MNDSGRVIEGDGGVSDFIIDALDGGWKVSELSIEHMPYRKCEDGSRDQVFNGPAVLLDRSAWQAVAKTRGWGEEGWKFHWDGYFGALRDGLDIGTAQDTWLKR